MTRQLGSATKEGEDLSLAAESTEAAVKVADEQQAEERPRFTLPELKDILQEFVPSVLVLTIPFLVI